MPPKTLCAKPKKILCSSIQGVIHAGHRGVIVASMAAVSLMSGYARQSYAGSCALTAPGVYVCSGAADGTGNDPQQSLTGSPLTVTTTSGFGIDTTNVPDLGISLNGTGGVTFTDTNEATIHAAYDAIDAYNTGAGALSITTTGDVVSTSGIGIVVFNSTNGTDLTISVVDVTGADDGIAADNWGSGTLSITSTGTVTGQTNDGIDALNRNGTDLTISVVDVTGADDGIEADNVGSGTLSITATGTITGQNNDGIDAANLSGSTDLTISVVDVTGGDDGIEAGSLGSGTLSITATGTITGQNKDGIDALNINGTDLTISVADVTGADDGIQATNGGSGALSITATGTVTGQNDDGIYASNSSDGTDLTISVVDVTADNEGIKATNRGSGALSITATGTVTGQNDRGILAANSSDGTDLTISVADVTGADDGINAFNYGSGALSITATGTVTGQNDVGIDAFTLGTDLTISVVDVTGDNEGIKAFNFGTGALSITATGTVTGQNDDGVDAINSGTDLTISVVDVTGAYDGIQADNFGTGALSITSTGTVTGQTNNGIDVTNNSGTDLTISVVDVTGGRDGIEATNWGSGAVSITATGTVTGQNDDGIDAFNSSSGTDLTISVVDVTGDGEGIQASLSGTGALSITSTGTVTGQNEDGIDASNSSNGTDLTISVVDVTGADDGINAFNYGSGALSITATGTVTGQNNRGIYAYNSSDGTGLSITAVAVTGADDAIDTTHYGSGVQSVTVSGDVTGGTGAGINTKTNADTMTYITLNGGAKVSSGSGLAIYNNIGDSLTTVNTGASIDGQISLGDGSDDLIFAGSSFSGVTLFDGGDDSSTADGFIDTLTLQGLTGTLAGGSVVNWEYVVFDNAEISFSDTGLVAGSGSGSGSATGLMLVNGATLVGGTAFELTGNMFIDGTSTFVGFGGGSGTYSVSGDLVNAGFVNMQDGAPGDRFTVAGDYVGNDGALLVDVALEGDSPSWDMLIVEGDTSGTTFVEVNNVGGKGALAVAGIGVVDVAGTSSGVFQLANPDTVLATGEAGVIAGAYGYAMRQNMKGDWVLQSMIQPAAPIYEAYAQTLMDLNTLPTMQQRIGNRYWYEDEGAKVPGCVADGNDQNSRYQHSATHSTTKEEDRYEDAALCEYGSSWVRVSTTRTVVDLSSSTTGTDYDQRQWQVQAGIDGIFHENDKGGRLILGLMGHYSKVESDINSWFGNGDIDTTAYGTGVTATWLESDGGYLDLQGQYSWFSSDLDSDSIGELVEDNDGQGYAISAEIGKKMAYGEGQEVEGEVIISTLTPQVQLRYTSIDIDRFIGSNSEKVSPDDVDSLELRLGLAADKDRIWSGGNGLKQRSHLYSTASLYYDFDGDSEVDVSGTRLSNDTDDWTIGLGLGYSRSFNDNKYAIYGEIDAGSGVENFGDSYRLSATIGFKMYWD